MNTPCCYCWQIYDERDKHECIGSLRAQRDKLLKFVKTLHAELFIDGTVHKPEELMRHCAKIINEAGK